MEKQIIQNLQSIDIKIIRLSVRPGSKCEKKFIDEDTANGDMNKLSWSEYLAREAFCVEDDIDTKDCDKTVKEINILYRLLRPSK